jgi:hypothetical protein
VTASAATTAAATEAAPSVTAAASRPETRAAAAEATRPENVERATKAAGAAGWVMVAGMLLALGASIGGAVIGWRRFVPAGRTVDRRDEAARAAVA